MRGHNIPMTPDPRSRLSLRAALLPRSLCSASPATSPLSLLACQRKKDLSNFLNHLSLLLLRVPKAGWDEDLLALKDAVRQLSSSGNCRVDSIDGMDMGTRDSKFTRAMLDDMATRLLSYPNALEKELKFETLSRGYRKLMVAIDAMEVTPLLRLCSATSLPSFRLDEDDYDFELSPSHTQPLYSSKSVSPTPSRSSPPPVFSLGSVVTPESSVKNQPAKSFLMSRGLASFF